MTTATLEAPQNQTGTDDGLIHRSCCDDDMALCGEDLTGHAWTDGALTCWECTMAEEMGWPCCVPTCPYGRQE